MASEQSTFSKNDNRKK